MIKYIINVLKGFLTILIGMKLTIGYLFKKPVTILYPEVKKDIPSNYRGLLKLNNNKCIACMQCKMTCPVSCIEIESFKVEGEKKKRLSKFAIDIRRCVFCGLCVETCPTKAIYFSTEYENAVFDKKELIFQFADENKPDEEKKEVDESKSTSNNGESKEEG